MLVLQGNGNNCKILFYLHGEITYDRKAREQAILAHRVKQLEGKRKGEKSLFSASELQAAREAEK